MRTSKYISVLLAFCIAVISCEREDRPVAQEEGRPIVFTAESEWSQITKAELAGRDDLIADGFNAWGVLHRETEGDPNTTISIDVFGTDGTGVSSQGAGDSLIPDKKSAWNNGYYSFAAIYPPSQFSGSLSSSFEKTTEDDAITTSYTDVLTVNLGESGFDLSVRQEDLMYAFENIDNSEEEASKVSLDFYHAFALLDVRLTHNGARVSKVSLYGIHDTVTGDLQFTHRSNGDSKTAVVTSNFGDLLTEATVSTTVDPYYEAEYTPGQGFAYTDETIAIVDDLLVFPETLSVTTALTIAVELKYNGQNKVFTATIDDGEWAPGGTYVYKIVVDTSKFDTTE